MKKAAFVYILSLISGVAFSQTYRSEEVVEKYIDGEGREVVLAGTLTLPAYASADGGFPAVVLVSGSGQQDRDESLFGHRPFRTIAEYLASRGIASLRFDDRGVGGSSGPLADATTYSFADDAEVMFVRLRKHPEVDPHRVGIVGHSEGGAIAPLIAARNADVAFVVMLAGQGCTGAETLLQQNEALFRLKGTPDSLVDVRLKCMRGFFDAMKIYPESAYDSVFKSIVNDYAGHLTRKERHSVGVLGGDAYLFAQQMALPWMKAFVALAPADYLPKVKCPVLALAGEKDCQVLAQPNIEAIRKLCQPDLLTTVVYDSMNHLLQTCQTGDVNEYATIKEDISETVLRQMSEWILQRAAK